MPTCTCDGEPHVTDVERLMAERTGLTVQYVHDFMDTWTDIADEVLSRPTTNQQPTQPQERLMAEQPARALNLPPITVPCPHCAAPAGQLCTSHGGTRVRRDDVHQARTAAYRAAP